MWVRATTLSLYHCKYTVSGQQGHPAVEGAEGSRPSFKTKSRKTSDYTFQVSAASERASMDLRDFSQESGGTWDTSYNASAYERPPSAIRNPSVFGFYGTSRAAQRSTITLNTIFPPPMARLASPLSSLLMVGLQQDDKS